MSLDKDASSDPNLKAVHAGASMRKAKHLQPKASDIAEPRWVVLPFPDSLPTFEYSPSRGKSPLCQQNDHFAPKKLRSRALTNLPPPRPLDGPVTV